MAVQQLMFCNIWFNSRIGHQFSYCSILAYLFNCLICIKLFIGNVIRVNLCVSIVWPYLFNCVNLCVYLVLLICLIRVNLCVYLLLFVQTCFQELCINPSIHASCVDLFSHASISALLASIHQSYRILQNPTAFMLSPYLPTFSLAFHQSFPYLQNSSSFINLHQLQLHQIE